MPWDMCKKVPGSLDGHSGALNILLYRVFDNNAGSLWLVEWLAGWLVWCEEAVLVLFLVCCFWFQILYHYRVHAAFALIAYSRRMFEMKDYFRGWWVSVCERSSICEREIRQRRGDHGGMNINILRVYKVLSYLST